MNRQQLEEEGAVRLVSAAVPFLDRLEAALGDLPTDQAGVRLNKVPGLAALLGPAGLGQWAEQLLGSGTTAVRAILFDKSQASNWALGWHQDRTIAVAERIEVPGFGPWSVKAGMVHVEPPFELIERMLTIRVHLDPVDVDDGPLRVAIGSHAHGRIAEADIDAIVERCGTLACLAERGDVWLYATPILHASPAAARPNSRRVLQVDYSADSLPAALAWLGV